VAASVAIALKAEKLILVSDTDGVRSRAGELMQELSAAEAERIIAANEVADEAAAELADLLRAAARRGALSPDLARARRRRADRTVHARGVGTMSRPRISKPCARPRDDVGGLLKLIAPLEADGTLVKRRAR